MKLSDLSRVGELTKERTYLSSLIANVGAGRRMNLGGIDVRPDLVGTMLPYIEGTLKAEIARVDRDLAALGVTVDEAEEFAS